jgi:hypothetical protein
MIRFLTLLLELIHRFFQEKDKAEHKQEGRQETIKEINDAINRQVELGEAAISVPDPERDERLRTRFDRSRTPQ